MYDHNAALARCAVELNEIDETVFSLKLCHF